MSADLPPLFDVWRMVANQRRFEGSLPIARMPRLCELLAEPEGDCRYAVEFYRDPLKIDVMHIRLEAVFHLICQRSVERFAYPVAIDQRLGLIRDETQEASLPEDMEAVLIDGQGEVSPVQLIEDELLLAVPLVPINPNASELDPTWAEEETVEQEKSNPFAALAALKDRT